MSPWVIPARSAGPPATTSVTIAALGIANLSRRARRKSSDTGCAAIPIRLRHALSSRIIRADICGRVDTDREADALRDADHHRVDADDATVTITAHPNWRAQRKIAGRDRGTNIVAFRQP